MVPAVGQGCPYDVRSRLHEIGHVIGLGLDPRVIVRPARGEKLIARLPAIDRNLIDAVCGRIEARTDDFSSSRELAPQQRQG